MRGPVKKFLLLLLLWSGFGFALNQYLEHKPEQSLASEKKSSLSLDNKSIITSDNQSSVVSANNALIESEIEEEPLNLRDDIELKSTQNQNDNLSTGDLSDELAQGYFISDENTDSSADFAAKREMTLGTEVLAIVRNAPEIVFQSEWEKIVNQLAQNMRIKPNLTLEIIGDFDPSEPIADPNLGIQRSVRVKNELVAAGLNPDRIKCRGNLQRLFDPESTTPPIVIKASESLLGVSEVEESLSASVSDTRSKENAEDAKDKINQDSQNFEDEPDDLPLRNNPNLPKFKSVVYAPTFSDQGIVVDTDLVNLIPGVRQWLDLDSKNYIEIWGHTDHVGHEQDNYRLALKWARQARSFLISKGINPNRIQALSAGEQQPLYTNSNLRGRQKNRRLELIFKF